MATYYADISLSGSGGSGTELDPWKADDFRTNVSDLPTDSTVLFILKVLVIIVVVYKLVVGLLLPYYCP